MHYLAVDLGAESGRVMLGRVANGRADLDEIHRFANGAVRSAESLHWDIERLMQGISDGLRAASSKPVRIASLSVDSWGVDYLLFDETGRVIEPTFHYRDPRSERGSKALLARITWPEIFAETGIQFMPINTLFQLAAESPERLAKAQRLLFIADGMHSWLSGVARAEVSLASTSQFYNPCTRTWSAKLLSALRVSPDLLPPIVASGTVLGPLRPELAEQTGLRDVQVVASCSHDTAAAVAAVPAEGEHWAYISSGTWSLLGVEVPEPIVNDRCRELNFTNEIGFGNSVRLLKNIVGLWIVQECRRYWTSQGRDLDYGTLACMAEAAPPFAALINPADARFLAPDDMPEKIAAFCRETGQRPSEEPGAVVRCILESLTLLYRKTAREIEELAGWKIRRMHIVGGGSQNALLNQFTADALQIPVIAGPAEATALGNILVQAIAMGELSTLAEARQIVRASSSVTVHEPRDHTAWDKAWERFCRF